MTAGGGVQEGRRDQPKSTTTTLRIIKNTNPAADRRTHALGSYWPWREPSAASLRPRPPRRPGRSSEGLPGALLLPRARAACCVLTAQLTRRVSLWEQAHTDGSGSGRRQLTFSSTSKKCPSFLKTARAHVF